VSCPFLPSTSPTRSFPILKPAPVAASIRSLGRDWHETQRQLENSSGPSPPLPFRIPQYSSRSYTSISTEPPSQPPASSGDKQCGKASCQRGTGRAALAQIFRRAAPSALGTHHTFSPEPLLRLHFRTLLALCFARPWLPGVSSTPLGLSAHIG
jgi:hypothetical protein